MSSRSNFAASRRGAAILAALAAGAALAVSGGLAASASAATLPTLTLKVTKTAITVGGTTQSGAVNVAISGSGVKEAFALLFALKPGVTVAEVENAIKHGAGKDPNKVNKYGAIVLDGEASTGHAWEAQTQLEPGQYVALSGEGEGEAKIKTFFTISAAASPAVLPAPQATVRSIEFGFRGPTTLHDGELVRFENEGFLVHMDVAFAAKSHNAAKKLVHDLLTGHEKGLGKLVSGEPVIFAGPLSSGAYQQETLTAKPGWYVQACFMETQDGRDHTRLGMERILRIVK